MEIQIGIAKTSRFDCVESRETFEIIERPGGGQSIVLCDSRIAGIRDKSSSSMVVNKIIGLISEGYRDSLAIKTVSNQIFRDEDGSIEGMLGMISVDLSSHSVVISRCTPIPVFFYQRGVIDDWENDCRLVGSSKNVSPSVTEIPLEPGTLVVMVSDGAYYAGRNYQQQIDIPALIQGVADSSNDMNARMIADFILNQAVENDLNQPVDDMSVIVMKIANCAPTHVRRMMFTVPINNDNNNRI